MQNQPPGPARMAALDDALKRDIARAVKAARPIDDLMDWLIAEYPDADREWIFAALKVVYDGDFTIAPAGQELKDYRIGLARLTAYPQRVE